MLVYKVEPAYDDTRYFSTPEKARSYVAKLTKHAKEFQDKDGIKITRRHVLGLQYWKEQLKGEPDVFFSFVGPEWYGPAREEVWEVKSVSISTIKVDEDDD